MPRWRLAGALGAGCPGVGDNRRVSDLIDTTEMYLRTIFELTEEGVLPMRARITERLAQSGPTVSQTVARMQRDGLLELDEEDRHVVLTSAGAERAMRVMRKHRLAECLLVDVIGLPWPEVHAEACRWEHVMSESVERRLLDVLGHPTVSPFGNPIPGLAELSGDPPVAGAGDVGDRPLLAVVGDDPRAVTLVRFAEVLQADEQTMSALRDIGATPQESVMASVAGDRVRIRGERGSVELSRAEAAKVMVAG